MRLHATSFCWLPLALAACGSGGSSNDAAGANGSVYVVIDTSTGTRALVQFQVAGALLERSDGTTTGNVLREPELVTFTDPSGELSGLQLRGVPSGEYEALHLMLVPGSGAVAMAPGPVRQLTGPVDLEIPIHDGLQHDAAGVSWLAVGHNVDQTVVQTGQGLAWQPALSARADGSNQEVGDLDFVLQQDTVVTTTLPNANDGVLQLEFDDDCTFGDDDDGEEFDDLEEFLEGVGNDADLRVNGKLRRDGRCVAEHARRGRSDRLPSLLGAIVELRPEEVSFVLLVVAEVSRGQRRLLDPQVEVLVRAGDARFNGHECQSSSESFASLAVGGVVKVKVASRTPVPGDRDVVVARRVQVIGANGVQLQPQWEGRVQSVDVATNTIVVVPREDDKGEPIVINGVAVEQVDVVLTPGMAIERRAEEGGSTTIIQIGGVVPGVDRIWWRGTVTGPTTIAATWVKVRADDD